MDTQEQTYRNAPFWLMLGGFIFLLAVPINIDCCRGFQGWFQSFPIFITMIQVNLITAGAVRSFEITLYAYLLACIICAVIYGFLNYKTMANEDILEGNREGVSDLRSKAIKDFSLLTSGLLAAIFIFSLTSNPQVVVRHGLKGWFLLRVCFFGSSFMLGLLVLLVSLKIGVGVVNRERSGVKK